MAHKAQAQNTIAHGKRGLTQDSTTDVLTKFVANIDWAKLKFTFDSANPDQQKVNERLRPRAPNK